MSSTPLPSRLVLLSSLPALPEQTKVRFLGCVTAFDVSRGTLSLQHQHSCDIPDDHAASLPIDTASTSSSPLNVVAKVDISLVASDLRARDTAVGAWLHVIGYVVGDGNGDSGASGEYRKMSRAPGSRDAKGTNNNNNNNNDDGDDGDDDNDEEAEKRRPHHPPGHRGRRGEKGKQEPKQEHRLIPGNEGTPASLFVRGQGGGSASSALATKPAATLRPGPAARPKSERGVKALLIWNAGSIDVGAYEKAARSKIEMARGVDDVFTTTSPR